MSGQPPSENVGAKAEKVSPQAARPSSTKAKDSVRQAESSRPAENEFASVAQGSTPVNEESAPNSAEKGRPAKAKATPWTPKDFPVTPVEGKTRFHDLGLSDSLLHGIQDLGFEYCSPIQAQALPQSLVGHDVLGKAQTGTGKTAAFLITLIEDLLKNPLQGERFAGEARAVIIAPTRELVMQIGQDAEALCKYTGLHVHTLVGGMDYNKQQRRLQDVLVDILVATPGRLLDFCGNQDVHLDQVEFLVIDEADRMLDMGFIPQVRRIVGQTPRKTHRQTLMFSATFSSDVLRLADQWMLDPVSIEIEPESIATDTVEQHVYLVAGDEKFAMLYNILQRPGVDTLIVFANRRDECRDLHARLRKHGIKAGLLSGEIAQNKRVKTLEDFRSGKLQVLVATDVAGRGIHINDVSHVVNFSLPEEPEDYVHRIGRTGRAGKTGVSISFACEDDAFLLPAIADLLGEQIQCEQPPEDLLAAPPEVEGGGPSQRKRPGRSSGPRGRGPGGRSGGRRR
jgi:ATP-dependent RNA helicase RhlB